MAEEVQAEKLERSDARKARLVSEPRLSQKLKSVPEFPP